MNQRHMDEATLNALRQHASEERSRRSNAAVMTFLGLLALAVVLLCVRAFIEGPVLLK